MTGKCRVATGLEALRAVAAVRTYEPVVICATGSLNPQGESMWRVGNHCAVHVYEGDRPIATFHQALDAEMAVAAVNNQTLVQISDQVIERCAADLTGLDRVDRSVAVAHTQAVIASLIDQGLAFTKAPPAMLPVCQDHRPVQHRDGKPAWCRNCGLTADFQEPVSRLGSVKPGRT